MRTRAGEAAGYASRLRRCAKNHHDSGIVVEAEGVQRLSQDKDERKEERGEGRGNHR